MSDFCVKFSYLIIHLYPRDVPSRRSSPFQSCLLNKDGESAPSLSSFKSNAWQRVFVHDLISRDTPALSLGLSMCTQQSVQSPTLAQSIGH